jgi:hypothetical protein
MRGHPSEGEILDWVVDDRGAEGLADHLRECTRCSTLESELRDGVEQVRRADLPGLAPPSWQAFGGQLRARLDGETRPFWGWSWVPALSTVGLVLALSVGVGRGPAPEPRAPVLLPAWAALPPDEADPGLAVLAALVDGEESAGCDLTHCLVSMSEDEERRVAEGLGYELGRSL